MGYNESTEPIDAVNILPLARFEPTTMTTPSNTTPDIDMYTEGYNESTEPIDAVNILPLARFEPTTMTNPPSTTPDIDATNCATETYPKKDVQEALILTMTDAVHIVYWFLFNI